jgi:putative protease
LGEKKTDYPQPELLLPAGTLQNLKTAFLYGADAVYCAMPSLGCNSLSLRSKSAFSVEEADEGIKFAHSLGKRVYLALNLYAHNSDLENISGAITLLKDLKPDGIIISDSGIFSLIKKELGHNVMSQMQICISTQANLTNWAAVDFWKKQGADKVVLARECSFEEIKYIREKCPDIKIETFIHGAMCMSMSGRCLISNFLSNRGLSPRDANRGECSQSCRWKYKLGYNTRFALEEENRKGEFFEIYEDDGESSVGGSYILSSKDLCLMPVLDKYLQIGVDSFKIEGRRKNEFYTANTAKAYRRAIDDWFENDSAGHNTFWNYENYMPIIDSISNRGFTLGFHNGTLDGSSHDYETTKSLSEYRFAGIVKEQVGVGDSGTNTSYVFEVRNTIEAGDEIEFVLPKHDTVKIKLDKIIDAKTGNEVSKASAGQRYCIRIFAKDNIPVNCVARIIAKLQDSDEKKIIENRKISFTEEICRK